MDDYRDGAPGFHLGSGSATASLGLGLHGDANAEEPFAPHLQARDESLPAQHAAALKRLMDIMVSAIMLLLLAPLLLLAALLVLKSGRPVLFKQPRVGLNGRVFLCYKFRSMLPDAERKLQELLQQDEQLRLEWQRSQKLRRDPRITRVGKLLRQTSIDELPQLWNVLRGDMSLIGPRPVMVDQLALYGPLAGCYTSMRPGITGLWQVTARGDGDFRRRIALDCEYIKNFSMQLDLTILLRTISVVLRGSGAY